MRGIIALFLVILLGSCSADLNPKEEIKDKAFFDLKGYFEEEAKRLRALSPMVTKTIISKDEKETQELETINWENELALFGINDINKPAWVEKYSVDSTKLKDGTLILTYEAKEEDLQTRKLDIHLYDEDVYSVIIVNRVNNAIYTSQQYLTYAPREGYTIKKTQDVTVMGKDDYEIEVSF